LKKELAKVKDQLRLLREVHKGTINEVQGTKRKLEQSTTKVTEKKQKVQVDEEETEDEEDEEEDMKDMIWWKVVKHSEKEQRTSTPEKAKPDAMGAQRIELFKDWKSDVALFQCDEGLQNHLKLEWVRKSKRNKPVYVQKSSDDNTFVPVYAGDIVGVDNDIIKRQYGDRITKCYVVGVYSSPMTRVNKKECVWTNKLHGVLYSSLQPFKEWFESFDSKECASQNLMIKRPVVELAPVSNTQIRFHLPIAFGVGDKIYDTGLRVYKLPNEYAAKGDKIVLKHPNSIYADKTGKKVHALFRWGKAHGAHWHQKSRYQTLYDAWCKEQKAIELTDEMVQSFIPSNVGNVRIPFDYFGKIDTEHDFYLFPNQYHIEKKCLNTSIN